MSEQWNVKNASVFAKNTRKSFPVKIIFDDAIKKHFRKNMYNQPFAVGSK